MPRIPTITLATALALFLFALTAHPATGEAAETGASFTVMTYNCGSAAVIPLTHDRIERIADEICDIGASVVGINEFDMGTDFLDKRDLPSELAVALADRGWPMYQHFGPVFPYRGGYFVHGLLSRYPILEKHRKDFGWNWVIHGITIEPVPGKPVNVFQTHIWPHSEDSPERARKMAEWVQTFKGANLFMGDFNTVPDSAVAKAIESTGLVSSCAATPPDECRSCGPGASMVSPLPLSNQIDYIWGNDKIDFHRSASHITSMSDHWPLWAWLTAYAEGDPLSFPNLDSRERPLRMRAEAMVRYKLGDYKHAAAILSNLAREFPEHQSAPFALYASGMMSYRAKNLSQAETVWRELLRRYPDTEWSTYATHRLAFLKKDKGEWQEAEDGFFRYINLYARTIDDNPYSSALVYTADQIIQCREKSGRKLSREQVYNEALTRFPSQPVCRMAHYQLAELAYDKGDSETWYAHHEVAHPGIYRYGPGQPDNDFKIARAYLAVGDTAKADENWKRFIAFYDDPLTIRRLWGQWRQLRYPESLHVDVSRVSDIRIDGDLSDWPEHALRECHGLPYAYRIVGDPAKENLTYGLAWNDANLFMAIAVSDTSPIYNHPSTELWRGDSLQIAIDPGMEGGGHYDANDLEFIFALQDQESLFAITYGRHDFDEPDFSISHNDTRGGETVYEIRIPLSDLGINPRAGSAFHFNALVNDQDAPDGPRLGWTDITPGIGEAKSPGSFLTATLVD